LRIYTYIIYTYMQIHIHTYKYKYTHIYMVTTNATKKGEGDIYIYIYVYYTYVYMRTYTHIYGHHKRYEKGGNSRRLAEVANGVDHWVSKGCHLCEHTDVKRGPYTSKETNK